MLEKIHGIPQRIASLKAKLKARDGKAEYKENCEAIRAEIARAEIARLESASMNREALEEFAQEEGAVASDPVKVT